MTYQGRIKNRCPKELLAWGMKRVLRNVEIFSILATMHAGIAQLVERHLAKVNVAGSNPVSRSTGTKSRAVP